MSGLVVPNELKGPFNSPFELFPIELWSLIFERVKDPQDLLNIRDSFDEWHDMLWQKRKFFLLPEILQILDKQELLNSYQMQAQIAAPIAADHSPPEIRKNTIFPILGLRLVCKSWDRAVQHFLQARPMHHTKHMIYGFDYPVGKTEERKFGQRYTFRRTSCVSKFIQRFEATHPPGRNPFVTRLVRINVGTSGEQEYWNLITHLLEKYRNHIYYLKFWFLHNYHVTAYTLLLQWLRLTRNLKVLKISCAFNYTEPTPQERQRLELLAQLAPMPKLKHLANLNVDSLVPSILNELFRRNDHLEKLQIKTVSFCPARYDISFSGIRLPNLNDWSIVISRRDIFHLKKILHGNTWTVKTLVLKLRNERSGDKLWADWLRVLRIVEEGVGQTLINLQFDFPDLSGEFILHESCKLRINLPHLKQMSVHIPFSSSVDFLVSLKESLEEVRVTVSRHCKWEEMTKSDRALEKIKFHGIFDRMEESNIWQLLPKLKSLELAFVVERHGGLLPHHLIKHWCKHYKWDRSAAGRNILRKYTLV